MKKKNPLLEKTFTLREIMQILEGNKLHAAYIEHNSALENVSRRFQDKAKDK